MMRALTRVLPLLGLLLAAGAAFAAPGSIGEVEKQPLNIAAIGMFIVFVGSTLGITYWAASRTKSTADFYTAGGGITGFQNGLAIAGDYMSAATLLGLSAMVFAKGFDGFVYIVAFFVGWPVILFLMAERLRNLGKPALARLNGIVVGGGNEFNLSCDLAVAADDIYIRHVGTSHGSVPLAGATQFLPLVVGERRAREIADALQADAGEICDRRRWKSQRGERQWRENPAFLAAGIAC